MFEEVAYGPWQAGDTPALQQAKGNPGRRKSKVAKRMEEAERVAQMLAASGEGDDVLAPPALLDHPAAKAALTVWTEYAPLLKSTNRLSRTHRLRFAMFCVYYGEWVTACADIQENGSFQKVKTVAGGYMERLRPVVQFREIAQGKVAELSQQFGLTPREEYALFRDQADAVAKNPGLFDRRATAQQPKGDEAEAPSAPAAKASLIGSLGSLDSLPPSGPPN